MLLLLLGLLLVEGGILLAVLLLDLVFVLRTGGGDVCRGFRDALVRGVLRQRCGFIRCTSDHAPGVGALELLVEEFPLLGDGALHIGAVGIVLVHLPVVPAAVLIALALDEGLRPLVGLGGLDSPVDGASDSSDPSGNCR